MNRTEPPTLVLHRTKFLLLIVLQIPAMIISLLIFVYLFTHANLLHSLQHQALLFLLMINFVLVTADLPLPMRFYYLGYVSPAMPVFCTWWTFFEYTMNLTSELLMATISLQRHVLVFQPHLFQIVKRRIVFYYLPLLLCLIYPVVLYSILILLYPCDGRQWNFTSNLCGYANCYLVYDKVLSTFDWGVNNGLPILVILLANIALIIRIIKQKRRQQHQPAFRRKQRRMALQLLSISSLYLLAWLPSLLIGISQQLISLDFLAQIQLDYAFDLIYLVCLLLPWICLRLFPNFTTWIWKTFICRQRSSNTIRPI